VTASSGVVWQKFELLGKVCLNVDTPSHFMCGQLRSTEKHAFPLNGLKDVPKTDFRFDIDKCHDFFNGVFGKEQGGGLALAPAVKH
jgi:hypothetical protein